jgi:hypothetical protein
MPTFWKLDCRRLTTGQLWRSSQTPLDFIVTVIGNFLGFNPASGTYPLGSYDESIVVDRDRVAPNLHELVRAAEADKSVAEMRLIAWYLFPTLHLSHRAEAAALLSKDRLLGLLITRFGTPDGETLTFSCTTTLQGGRIMATMSGHPLFALPDRWEVVFNAGPSAAAVLERQVQRLKERVPEPMTPEQVTPVVIALEREVVELNEGLGVLVELSEAEVAELRGVGR